MYLVTSFGAVYRMSEAQLRRQLRAVASGIDYSLDKAQYLGQITCSFSAIDGDEAREILASINRNRRQASLRSPATTKKE